MRLRVALACLSLLGLAALAAPSARAEAAGSTVLLVDPGSAPLTHRLREEIERLKKEQDKLRGQLEVKPASGGK